MVKHPSLMLAFPAFIYNVYTFWLVFLESYTIDTSF